MKQVKRKKLNLQVKRGFQMWMFYRVLGAIFLSCAIAALILYFYSNQELGESFYEAHLKIRKVSDLLIPVILSGAFVSLLSGVLLVLFFPQKVAGPVYRIEEDLKAVQNGDLSKRIKLREGDPMQSLADTINKTLDNLQDKIPKSE